MLRREKEKKKKERTFFFSFLLFLSDFLSTCSCSRRNDSEPYGLSRATTYRLDCGGGVCDGSSTEVVGGLESLFVFLFAMEQKEGRENRPFSSSESCS